MDNQPGIIREMALFAGAGGGILGGHLLGWTTVCAVEWEPYPACVLVARQNDKILPPFPIWDDVQTFDGKPWRGLVDVVSGGFPCQDISSAGGGQELTELGQACGVKWHELSAKYDLDSCSWRTHQCLWDEELPWSSVTLPRWGMTVSGVLFQHPTAERPISETGSGYWLTPTTMNIAPTESRREKRTAYRASVGRRDSPGSLAEQVMTPKFWPTPSAHKNTKSGELINKDGTLWDGISKPHSKKSGKQVQTALADAVTKWPTPTAHNAKETNAPSESNRNEPTLASRVGGHLNPMWVEWLMAFPLGWTDLKPLAMDRFQSWQQQHLEYCEADE